MSTVSPVAVDFDAVDVVLLDLDGTLLDLAFDNYVWLEHVPGLYAVRAGLSRAAALQELAPKFRAREGTLEWYCTQFWSRELGLDIASIHRELAARIRWLPGAQDFLRRVRARHKRLVLLTNSHPDTLAIKHEATALREYFDAVWSSHQFGVPKEDPRFWERIQTAEKFEPARALFVDDSESVLHAARAAGIGHVIAVRRSDSSRDSRRHEAFPAIDAVGELLA